MAIKKDQAIALLCALFSTQCVGSDNDGNEYGPERNAHFLDCLRVLYPDLPSAWDVIRVINLPTGAHPEDYRHNQKKTQEEKRARFAEILREIASAIVEPEAK